MRKSMLLLALVLMAPACDRLEQRNQNRRGGKTVAITDATFTKQVLESDLPVLVDFTATWCGPCQRLAPILEELAGDFTGQLKVVKLDVDESPTTPQQFGVSSMPTLMLFHQGRLIDHQVGLQSKSALTNWLKSSLPSLAQDKD